MGRRHQCIYNGTYSHINNMPTFRRTEPGFQYFARLASTYFWAAFNSINGQYVAIMTVCLVVLLSFMLPDVSQKVHRTAELKSMKNTFDLMSKEVSRAEVACLTVADQIGLFKRSMHDHTTETLKDQQDLAVCTSESMRTTQSAPVQVEKKRGFLRRIFFPNRNTSNKEIAIMSYVYTDSFDAAKKTPT